MNSLDKVGQPQRLLDPLGAIALIVGIVIGAGIFKTPALVAALIFCIAPSVGMLPFSMAGPAPP